MKTAHNSLAALPWAMMDWTQHDTVIAEALGCCRSTVGIYRRQHAPATVRPRIPWERVKGWSRRANTDIAAELNVSRRCVEAYRREKGLPQGPRSPGSGMHKVTGQRKAKPMTLHEKGLRLEALWAFLWPDDPQNVHRLDEVREIKTRLESH